MRRALFAALAAAAQLAAGPQSKTTPDFARDIAPIIYKICAPCHRPGEVGPFPLLSYSDVKKHARQIAEVTRSRYMPPWLPEPGYGEFQDARRLSEQQIETIAAWVKAGAPRGNPQGRTGHSAFH